jgi:hypothetical protein
MTLIEIFESKAKLCESIAKDTALAAIMGKADDRPENEQNARDWMMQAKIWEQADRKSVV